MPISTAMCCPQTTCASFPANQREQARAFDESFSKPAKPKETAPQAPAASDPAQAQALEAELKQLEEQEQNLNREYDDLMKQRSMLDEEKANAIAPAQLKEYNQKIVGFNSLIQSYEGKRDAYSEKV